MSISRDLMRLRKESLDPPALVSPDAGDAKEIPWVLLEYKAFVADRRNSTTAFSDCRCNGQIQATLFLASPPRVSYLCVFCRRRPAAAGEDHHTDEEEQGGMIVMEPEILATDENLILFRILVSDEKVQYLHYGSCVDLFIYQPAGDGGPLLTRLERPAPTGKYVFNSYQVGLVSCPSSCGDDHPRYMVAALCDDMYAFALGRFVLHLYDSKLQAWTTTKVSVSDEYKDDTGFFHHTNTKVIAVGGEDATIAFVDLWRGILLCDLSHVKYKPCLRYVPLPNPAGPQMCDDARLSRDIAVVKGHLFKYVCKWHPAVDHDDWESAIFTRPVSTSSLLDHKWEPVNRIYSVKMNTEDSPDFHLLPKLVDRPLSPFYYLHTLQPSLGLDDTDTVCFMVKINHYDAKAWVIAVDMKNNGLRGVAEFNASRYTLVGFAYLHSRISKYLKMDQGTKENLKRQGILLQGLHNKKLELRCEHKQQDAEVVGMPEDRGDADAMPME